MRQPVLTGVSASVVGFASAATVVLAGLDGVGATPRQAASGLLAVSVAMGACSIWLSVRTRLPMLVAWSTPGAALLIGAGVPEGGWPAAVGAFLVAAVLTLAAGRSQALARAITRIPGPIAAGLLAGVLLPLCLAPARAVAELPDLAGPVVAVWLALAVLARAWAVPGAVLAAVVVLVVDGSAPPVSGDLLPAVTLTAPAFRLEAVVGIALPLFVVTMASQNVTGAAVLQAFGFRADVPQALTVTGAASAAATPFGGHGVNLAAITAALVATPDADPDPGRRWIASTAAGVASIVLGLSAGALAAAIAAAPPLLVQAVAGLALLGALGGALAGATEDPEERDAAVVTFVVSAAAFTAVGITAPFWGLLAGLGFRAAARRSVRPG